MRSFSSESHSLSLKLIHTLNYKYIRFLFFIESKNIKKKIHTQL